LLAGLIADALGMSAAIWTVAALTGASGLSDRDRRIILVCADGYSSSLAAATLRDLGFSRATDLAGGFDGWVAAGIPVDQLAGS
jgi:rhodanese-related sulfurtransferase